MRTVVHAEEAEGVWNYAGGVVGAVRMGGRISNATVSGSVTGGIVSVYKETNTHSSTGGIVGHVDKASVRGGLRSIMWRYLRSIRTIRTIPTIRPLGLKRGTLSAGLSVRWQEP